jgi:RHS repeat-associated protein
MDGKRLRLTSGTYGQAGSTYQTEIADFSNVTAYGTAGNGPAYWIVKDRNGRSYQYGNGGNSQVLATNSTTALSWMLNSVSDPAGNTMTISYTAATGTAVPNVISWTPSAYGSTSYNYTMTFGYGTNFPQSSQNGYVAGTSVVNTNLLNSITIAYGGTTVKKYVLSYQSSPTTGRDQLITVTECADTGATNCLRQTTIAYQPGQAGVVSTASVPITNNDGGTPHVYDVNGDGFPDLIYRSGSLWYIAMGSPSGYGTPFSTGVPYGSPTLFGDLLANGKSGVLANNGGTWYYYTFTSSGNAFSGVSTGLAYDATRDQYILADIDGDGRPDLVAGSITGPTISKTTTIWTRLNTSSSTAPSFSSTAVAAYSTPGATAYAIGSYAGDSTIRMAGNLHGLDFDGDGRQDIALQFNNGTTQVTWELTSNGSTFTPHLISSDPAAAIVTFLNFNSDGCTEFIANGVLHPSGCNGASPTTVNVGSANVLWAMDWDGDGRTDLVVQNGTTLGVYLSTGAGFGNLITTNIPSSGVFFTLDANGDGLDDLGYWDTNRAIGYYLHNGAGQPPDLVTSIMDGYGNSVSPTYVSVAQTTNGHYFNLNDAVYPYKNYVGPLYVVSLVTFSDPSGTVGATYQQTYYYGGAWTNLQGRGFAGMGNVQIQDSRNGVWKTWGYGRAFPYTGMYAGENGTQNNSGSTLLWSVTPTLNATQLSSTLHQERYFLYSSNVTRKDYELGSSQNRVVSTTSRDYSYDSYGNATEIKTTVTDNDSGSPYYTQSWTTDVLNTTDISVNPSADLAAWCLTLLHDTQVTYTTTPATTTVVRTQTFTPDVPASACRIKTVVTEPTANGGIYKVTETFGFDSFGNVNSDSVTGVNMTARLTTIDWGTTGQFPMTVTDPSVATTTYDYNFSYGLVSSVKDPNLLPTSRQYGDGFGRPTQENRPDGTYTQWTYADCATQGGCLAGSHGLEVTPFVYNKDGSQQSVTTDMGDPIDRPLLHTANLLANGTYSRQEVRYDPLGRLASRAAPCTWVNISTLCNYWTTMTYDVLNRPAQIQRPISATNSTLQTTLFGYAGRTSTVTDPQTFATTLVTNVNGWRRKTTDAYGYALTFDYDPAGSQTRVTDSSGNTLWSGTYLYGIAPLLVGETDMDRGTWTYTVSALAERTGWTDAKTQSFSQSYDALSRPLTRTEPDLFTQWTWGSTPANHNVGRLQSVCTGTGANPTTCTASPGYSESEGYDSLGRLYQRAIAIPSTGTFTYTWLYNGNTGLLDTLTYPVSTSSKALVLKYAYQNGFVQSITDTLDSPNVTVWQANSINPAGQLTQETLGNGLVTNRNYDAVTHWLGSVQSGVGGGTAVENLGFLYDLMGNVTQRQDNKQNLTENIYYDNLYRFSYSTLLNGTQNEGQNLSVHYDLNGNITSRSDVASGATWTYDPVRKHAVTQAGSSSFSYAYDANGNVNNRQGSTVTWSSYNYPLSISAGSGATAESVSFAYGPDRQRWQQVYSGSTYETTNYVGNLLKIVTAGGVTDYRHYIYAGNQAVAVYSRKSAGTNPNTFSYLLSDHQGSIASITDSSGVPVVGESFTPFGTRRDPRTWSGAASNADLTASAGVTRQGYTFQTSLGLWMGLNHMNGRVQDAITGRFMSADPAGTNEDLTQSWNRYSYAGNNPLTYTDPTGFANKQLPTDGSLTTVDITAGLGDTAVVTVSHDRSGSNSIDLLSVGLETVTVSTLFGTQRSFTEVGEGQMATVTVSTTKPRVDKPQGNLPEVTVSANRPVSGPPVIPISPYLAPYPAGTYQSGVNTMDIPYVCRYSRANNPKAGRNILGGMAAFGSIGATIYTVVALANLEDGGGEVMLALRAAQIARNSESTMFASTVLQTAAQAGGATDVAVTAFSGGGVLSATGAMAGAFLTTEGCR